jgi:ribosomal protein S3AE
MAKKPRRSGKKNVVKKKWYPIKASKQFGQKVIGESYLAEPQKAIGRIVTVSMNSLGGEHSKQYINVSFKIKGYKEDFLTTEMVGYKFSPSVNKRFVRRRRTKVEDSFVVSTSDGAKIRIKPLVVTRTKAQGGVAAALKKEVREFFILELHKLTTAKFWEDVVGHKIQKRLFSALKKVHPLSACEIRWALVEGEGVATPEEEEETVVSEENNETPVAEEVEETTEEVVEEEPAVEEAEA